MIAEDQLDRHMARIVGVEELEEFDEFAASAAVLDESIDLTGDEIDAGQQADCALALVFVVAREGVSAGRGRQVRGGRGDGLNARLLVVQDDRHRIARFLFCRRRLLDESHFAIDAQNLGHLLLELRIAAFQVVADLVRLHLFLIEDLAHRALSQLGKASVPLCRPMLTRMAGEQPRRPQFVGIAEVLGLAAGEVDNPCLGRGGDRRLLARPRTIVERRHRTIGQRPLHAALDGLMVRAHGPPHRKKRRVFPVGQQHPRSLDPARRFRSRAGNRAQRRQILLANRQSGSTRQERPVSGFAMKSDSTSVGEQAAHWVKMRKLVP